MDVTFKNEMGAVVTPLNKVLTIVEGEVGHVDFPEEFILNIHKLSPGEAFKLAHTHPTGMIGLSTRDVMTLKTWAFTLYPFPIRMSTITFVEDHFRETIYLALLEPKEIWIRKGKGERKFEVSVENSYKITDDQMKKGWMATLISKSYDIRGNIE